MAYRKPLLFRVGDLAEGVYAASGDVAAQEVGGSASYVLKQTNAWDGNKQYDITFTNHLDHKVDSVTVEAKAKGHVSSIGGNVSGVVEGDKARITFNNYGIGIEAGDTVGPIYMAVTGEGDFSLE